MSVVIKGMEMPKNCDTCFLSKWDTCNERFYCMFDDCPLVEVPEPYGEHLCEDEVVSCLEGADWINEVIRIFLDLQAEVTE